MTAVYLVVMAWQILEPIFRSPAPFGPEENVIPGWAVIISGTGVFSALFGTALHFIARGEYKKTCILLNADLNQIDQSDSTHVS